MDDLQRLTASKRAHRSHVSKLFKRSEELSDSIIETLQRKNEVLGALDENITAKVQGEDKLEKDIIE